MTLDDEILAEERLDEDQELMLYNMSLRQTSQRAAGGREGTHVLLSAIEGNAAYQLMIDRGLIERKLYGQAGDLSTAAATLIVTQKGLRYCVLYAEEIEPRRVYDVAGVQREGMRQDVGDGGLGVNYALLTSGMALGGSVAKDAAVALTNDQVEQLETLGMQRRARELDRQGEASGIRYIPRERFGYVFHEGGSAAKDAASLLSKDEVERFEELGAQRRGPGASHQTGQAEAVGKTALREYVSCTGDVWSYIVADGPVVQIVGVSGSSKSLYVPSAIEDAPVVSIAADALSENDFVEEIICPDSIEQIGARAFRLSSKLRRLVLPANVAEFQSSWIYRCPNLQELVLPGLVEEVTRDMLEGGKLEKLEVGAGTRCVRPGAFQDTCLVEVKIDKNNPHLATDGDAIYSKDGTELIALVRPVQSLAVAVGCEKLAKKCCCGFKQLKEVKLPGTIAEIGPFAFAHAGIKSFVAPPSLRVIGEKAFFGCTDLATVSLSSGLRDIGESAFEGSAISRLVIPASIRRLGKSMTKGTGIVHSGPGCTLSIDGECEDLLLDGMGGLYRLHDDGLHLMQLVDGDLESYHVLGGTVAIDPYAFAYHDSINAVCVPESVTSIGRSAFRICKNLRHVELPDSVASIGDEAFFDTNLEEFRVPAALSDLGERALVTYGAHHGGALPSLARIEVAPGNETFYLASGMLCRKTDSGASVVVFDGSQPHVVFPDEVTRVDEFAFSNARGIEYLALNARLASIGSNGLATRCWIRHIHVDRDKPVEGRTSFDFHFPDTPGAVRGIALGLSGASWVNIPGLVEQRDLCLVSARDYNAPGKRDNISAYAQAKLILDRFDDPVMLTPHNKNMMERVLRNNIEDICVDVALYDDRAVLGSLIDRGFVNADNLDGVIERVGALRDAATSAFLLETKREKFAQSAFDYDL